MNKYKMYEMNKYVSLRLRVQNAVPAQPLCWKVGNISGSTELFALYFDYGLKLHKLLNHTLVMLQKWLEIH